jgi:hypothetical protein
LLSKIKIRNIFTLHKSNPKSDFYFDNYHNNLNLIAQIDHLGAELCSLKNNQKIEYIWEGNIEFWASTPQSYFPLWEL